MSVWNQMNGWQRLWLTLSALSFVVLGLVYPLMTVYGGNPGQIAFREVLLKELRSGQCSLYIDLPLAELREPPTNVYGVDCSAIYFSRKASGQDVYPYTIEAYDAREAARKRQDVYLSIALFSCMSAIASSLVYGLGLVIARLRQGFSQIA
jgi:hypothetical protein